MSKALADSLRDRCNVVAVSDAYKLASWADALASTDARWWRHNPDALNFAGKKFTAAPEFAKIAGVEHLQIDCSTNSGLLGAMVAANFGAKRILLCGLDMGGAHFFGDHKPPLKNPNAQRFEIFKRQFASYRPRGIEILNCTPGSALKTYPFADLEDALAQSSVSAA